MMGKTRELIAFKWRQTAGSQQIVGAIQFQKDLDIIGGFPVSKYQKWDENTRISEKAVVIVWTTKDR